MTTLQFPPDIPEPKKQPLKVSIDGDSYICPCGIPMVFCDSVHDAPQRRIVCAHTGCQQYGVVYLEPALEAFPL